MQIDYSPLPEKSNQPPIRRMYAIISAYTFGAVMILIVLGLVFRDKYLALSESIFTTILLFMTLVGVPIILWVTFKKLRKKLAQQAHVMNQFATVNRWSFSASQIIDGHLDLLPSDYGPIYGRLLYHVTGVKDAVHFDLYAIQAYVKQTFGNKTTLAYQTIIRVPLDTFTDIGDDNTLQIVKDSNFSYVIMQSNAIDKQSIATLLNVLTGAVSRQ